MSDAGEQREAVVLSGGGAYGAYEVGVLKALFTGECSSTGYQPLRADVFAGTSVGSFNAAVMSMHPGAEGAYSARWLEKIWLEIISSSAGRCGNGVYRFRGFPMEYLDYDCLTTQPSVPVKALSDDTMFFGKDFLQRSLNFLLGPGSVSDRVVQTVDLSAFISITPFQGLIQKTISLEGIRNSERRLRIATTNWETGALAIFENKDFIEPHGGDVIMASAAIPGIFPPVKVGNTTYVDGGVVMNTPLRLGIDAGATVLHVVYMDPDIRLIPWRRLQCTLDTMDRMYTIQLATTMNEDVKTAVWVNEGLDVLDRLEAGENLADTELQALVRVLGQIERMRKQGSLYRPLTIHRYHPRDDLGGMLGLLDFREVSVQSFIQRGFFDTVRHDCAESGCVLPSKGGVDA